MNGILILASAALTLSCYASHSIEERADAGEDGGARPSLPDLGGRDAGTPDAEVPLPPEPVPDPGPDGRPSDDEGADDWEEPPTLDPEDPCCLSLGEPQEIRHGRDTWGHLMMEWNGDGWGVLWSSRFSAFQPLDRDGSPVGPIRWLGVGALGGNLHWSGGRYGTLIAGAGDDPQDKVFALLDARGVRATPWTDLWAHLPSIHARLARVEHMNRWLVVEGYDSPLNVVELDGEGVIVDHRELEPMVRAAGVKVVALKSRAVVFSRLPEHAAAHVLTVPIAESTIDPVILSEDDVGGGGAAARLRDAAVWLTNRDATGRGDLFVFDPFDGAAEHHTIDRLGRMRAMAGVDRYDLLAVCTRGDDPDEPDGLALTLFDRSGQQVGRSVGLTSGERTFGQCAIGVDGDRLFVAWNDYHRQRLLVHGFRIRSGS